MRILPPGLAAALAPGAVATLCTGWILTRADKVVLGFTDHDLPVTLNGTALAPQTGWTLGTAETELGGGPGTLAAQGALDSAALTEADIAAGRYDGAKIEAWRFLADDPTQQLLLWRGAVARLSRTGASFTAELEGPLHALRKTVGRTYQRTCDATLGDSRCRADLTRPGLAGKVCDHHWRTCRDTFANLINFQGFPDIPGDDFIAAYPVDSPVNTGGSRRA